ncbi:MAG: hypothetical protein QXS19_07640 [Candidatus Methanomethylicia archaeon]
MIIRAYDWIIDTSKIVAIRVTPTLIIFVTVCGKDISIPLYSEYEERDKLLTNLQHLIKTDGIVKLEDLLEASGYKPKK